MLALLATGRLLLLASAVAIGEHSHKQLNNPDRSNLYSHMSCTACLSGALAQGWPWFLPGAVRASEHPTATGRSWSSRAKCGSNRITSTFGSCECRRHDAAGTRARAVDSAPNFCGRMWPLWDVAAFAQHCQLARGALHPSGEQVVLEQHRRDGEVEEGAG